MNITLTKADPTQHKSDLLIIPVSEGKTQSPAVQALDQASGKLISQLKAGGDFSGKAGESFPLVSPAGIAAKRLLLVGTGKHPELSVADATQVLDTLSSALGKTVARQAAIFLDELTVAGKPAHWLTTQIARAAGDSQYRFTRFKSDKDSKPSLKKFSLLVSESPKAAQKRALAIGKALVAGQSLAKDLGNLPGNVCTPTYLASEARKLARSDTRLTAQIIDEKEMAKMGAGAFYSVAKGSDQPGKLIVMTYSGAAKSTRPYVLVGKGITFDTGGISLKPGAAMDEMKYDMCGAASVFGCVKAVMELGLPINLVAIVAAAENMPSGGASKPGDIVTSLSGQTIEILNTDAEGRLVLCDALTYAERFKPKTVIDIATLTGACVVALGDQATAIYSNSEDFQQQLVQAGQDSHDRGWPMPLWDEYQKQLDSPFADMANIGGPKAGSITAACFLSRFAKNFTWAHLDIAGTAWNSGQNKGATGRPVGLLLQYLLNDSGKA